MNDETVDQAHEEDLLSYEVSDEALEAIDCVVGSDQSVYCGSDDDSKIRFC